MAKKKGYVIKHDCGKKVCDCFIRSYMRKRGNASTNYVYNKKNK